MLKEEDRAEVRRLIEEQLQSLGGSPRFEYAVRTALKGQASEPGESLPEALVDVTARAIEVLGTREKALRWLKTPVRSLGDQTPLSLLGRPEGVVRVEDALGRIEHGVW